MIIGSLKNASRYFGLGDGVKKGLEFLLTHDVSKMEDGKYDVDGEKSWATIMRRTTKPKNKTLFETHIKYIDLQMDIEGEEWFGYTPEESLSNSKEYDAERDIQFHDGEGFFL